MNDFMKKINFWLDDQEFFALPGETVLHAVLKTGKEIPHVCFGSELEPTESCRTCIVEDEKTGRIVTSCALVPKEGMRLRSDTEKIRKARTLNLELLFAGHAKRCPDCKEGRWCKIAQSCEKYGVDLKKFTQREIQEPIEHFDGEPVIEFDPSACINCGKCIEACKKCSVCYLLEKGSGNEQTIGTLRDKIACIFCGQCTVVCPTGAMRAHNSIAEVEAAINNPKKIVIVQPAPSIRSALGEGWATPFDKHSTGKMYAAFRKLGFDKIFDVNFGADITTMVEAGELAERLGKNKHLPMFTSCCPAWVRYVEHFQPQLLPHLTTARSPHIHSGGAFKTWWAQKNNINPDDIFVVSIMPCTSKKYEITRKEYAVNKGKHSPVDAVLTTRELITMMKERKIEWTKLKDEKPDEIAEYSGAGAIYGASGGVMESALRTAAWKLTGKNLPKLELTEVRGMAGIKTSEIKLQDKTIRVAVVSTVHYIPQILAQLKNDPEAYHYIEVMACPGGCVGGGGQPAYDFPEQVDQRRKNLYTIDDAKKVRCAHENKLVEEYLEWCERQPSSVRKSVLETHFFNRQKK